MGRVLLAGILVAGLRAPSAPGAAPPTEHHSSDRSVVTNWVAREATVLRGGVTDITALQRLIGNARVVALGEATHGAREEVTLRLHLLKTLIEYMGFDALIIEAGWSESLGVNDYVTTGQGDPETALRGLGFWTLQTQEMLGVIQYLRSFNASDREKRPVHFYGCDMQTPGKSATLLDDYLAAFDEERLQPVFRTLRSVREAQDSASRDRDSFR
jgi:erythromycin esterase